MIKKAYTINEFCKTYDISRSTFYKLQAIGKAPQIFSLGRRILISASAAEEWLIKMENEKTISLNR